MDVMKSELIVTLMNLCVSVLICHDILYKRNCEGQYFCCCFGYVCSAVEDVIYIYICYVSVCCDIVHKNYNLSVCQLFVCAEIVCPAVGHKTVYGFLYICHMLVILLNLWMEIVYMCSYVSVSIYPDIVQ